MADRIGELLDQYQAPKEKGGDRIDQLLNQYSPNSSQEYKPINPGYVPSGIEIPPQYAQAATEAESVDRPFKSPAAPMQAMNAWNSVMGAPVRAGIYSKQNGGGFFRGYKNQFAEDPDTAPSGKDIMIKAGASTDPIISSESLKNDYSSPEATGSGEAGWAQILHHSSPAGLLGLGTEIAADPANAVSFLHGSVQAASKIPELAESVSALKNTISKTGEIGAGMVGTGGQAFTGTPKIATTVRLTRGAEAAADYAKAGGSSFRQADNIIKENSAATQGAKNLLSNQISEGLKSAPIEKNISIQPIIDKLEASKNTIDPGWDPESINQIDEIISTLNKTNPDGLGSLKSIHSAKENIRNLYAKNSYLKGGQIYPRSDAVQNAAKGASAEARAIFNTYADKLPEAQQVKEANDQLANLHDIEEGIDNRLLGSKGNNQVALSNLANGNLRGLPEVEDLEKITGYPLRRKAENFYSSKYFHDPDVFHALPTGRAWGPAVVGERIGGLPGMAVGLAAGSPLTLRTGIDLTRGAGSVAKTAYGLLSTPKISLARGLLNQGRGLMSPSEPPQ